MILTVPYILIIPYNLHIYIRLGTKLPVQQNLISPIQEKCLLLFTVHNKSSLTGQLLNAVSSSAILQ